MEQHKLAVSYHAYPESNGKTNWTVELRRVDGDGLKGSWFSGRCFYRGEHHGRGQFHAEELRFLIGDRETEPDILMYDDQSRKPGLEHLAKIFGYMHRENRPWDKKPIMAVVTTTDGITVTAGTHLHEEDTEQDGSPVFVVETCLPERIQPKNIVFYIGEDPVGWADASEYKFMSTVPAGSTFKVEIR